MSLEATAETTRLLGGVRYCEADLHRIVRAKGWSRSDLARAHARDLVLIEIAEDGVSLLVTVLPSKARELEALLTERALHWNNYFAWLALARNRKERG